MSDNILLFLFLSFIVISQTLTFPISYNSSVCVRNEMEDWVFFMLATAADMPNINK